MIHTSDQGLDLVDKTETILGSVEMTPRWFKDGYGIVSPNPFETDTHQTAELEARKSRILYERFPDLPIGEENPVALDGLPMYDARIIAASAYCDLQPKWDYDIAAFWIEHDVRPLSWMQSAADVAKVQIPDWSQVPLMQQMLQKMDELKAKNKFDPLEVESYWDLRPRVNPETGKLYRFSNFMSYVDLGAYLYGHTEFFTMLASDHEFGNSFLEKCFEISVSYREFLSAVFGLPIEAIANFGGDYSCVLSPASYREYGMRYDMMLVERYGDLPCNLHSCGQSDHLYETWATYSNLHNIVQMQTRGIPGKLKKLRNAMPSTTLQITLLPPQFDFESVEPDAIEAQVREFVSDADFRDIELHLVITKNNDAVDRNIRTFFQTLDSIKRDLRTPHP